MTLGTAWARVEEIRGGTTRGGLDALWQSVCVSQARVSATCSPKRVEVGEVLVSPVFDLLDFRDHRFWGSPACPVSAPPPRQRPGAESCFYAKIDFCATTREDP